MTTTPWDCPIGALRIVQRGEGICSIHVTAIRDRLVIGKAWSCFDVINCACFSIILGRCVEWEPEHIAKDLYILIML